MKRVLLPALLALGLTACKEDVDDVIGPVSMTDEALGHYCQMFVAEHPGPKAQIHLEGYAAPLWFSQVTDAVAYMYDLERQAEVSAIFVSDMSRAESWAMPGPDNWVDVFEAHLVIESDRPGGMGVPEAIPFSRAEDAQAFVRENGGRIVAFGDVPPAYAHPDMDIMTAHDMEGMN